MADQPSQTNTTDDDLTPYAGMKREEFERKHTESGRLAMYEAASDLRRLIGSGWLIPPHLRTQVEATAASLIAEADA